MGNCPACPTGTLREQLADTWQKRRGRWVLLRNVPAQVCDTCGEKVFSQRSAERIARIVAAENQDQETGTDIVLVFDLIVMDNIAHRGLRPTPTDVAQGTTADEIGRVEPHYPPPTIVTSHHAS